MLLIKFSVSPFLKAFALVFMPAELGVLDKVSVAIRIKYHFTEK
jgi:hypothetical protein